MTELNQTKKKSSFAGAVGGFYDKAKRSFDSWKAWIYLSPAIVLLLIFTAWPIFNTVKMAFTNGYNSFDALGGKSFTFGIQNFISVMVEFPDFVNYLINTMLLCIATVPISTILALLIAVCLNSIKPLQKFLHIVRRIVSPPDGILPAHGHGQAVSFCKLPLGGNKVWHLVECIVIAEAPLTAKRVEVVRICAVDSICRRFTLIWNKIGVRLFATYVQLLGILMVLKFQHFVILSPRVGDKFLIYNNLW